MIYKELEKIVLDSKRKGNSEIYIRNLLKEYLQIYVLNYIYTNKEYNKNLIFTGGTCLRHFYNLPRLSEDLDFDYNREFNSKNLLDNLLGYFQSKYQYTDMSPALKQDGKQILLKFPILRSLNLTQGNESEMLYIKIDLKPNPSDTYKTEISSKSMSGFNFVALHYDLSTLMAGKILAILTRKQLIGKDNRETVKGRDYFDLLWYLKQEIMPNIERISAVLNEKITMGDLKERLDNKVTILMSNYKNDFKSDLLPLIENQDFIPIYIDNYMEEYNRSIKYFKKYI